jgi:hypothetical protein
VTPLVSNLDDISCRDDGAPLDPTTQDPLASIPNPDPPFDGSECVESVQEVNKKVKDSLDSYTAHNILLNKLYELHDNLKPLETYYLERSKRMAQLIGIFEPILREIKRLEELITKIRNEDLPDVRERLDYARRWNSAQVIESIALEEEELQSLLSESVINLREQRSLKDENSKLYPALMDPVLLNTQFGVSPSSLISSINKFIGSTEKDELRSELLNYSEFIKMNIVRQVTGLDSLLSNPAISFNIQLQNLISIKTDREKFDVQTGDRSIYQEVHKIIDSPLLEKTSFFESVPGYKLTHIEGKQVSRGRLYTDYYNKLEDPINEFFSTGERGLTSIASQLDPKLKGSDHITKREKGKDYYIRDLELMQQFYQNFDELFESKKKQVRNQVVEENTENLTKAFEKIARADIDILLSVGRINFDLPEDSEVLRTVIDKIKDANLKFVNLIKDLQDEISRIENIMDELKPTPEKVRKMLKEESSICFDKIDDAIDSPCQDTLDILGSDPFFESLDGINPTLPNFSQACYWDEFSKLANNQGLFPIPNDPRTLRYWPVGLTIPTPLGLVKIPLPIIWIPLVTISTPLGVMQMMLTINGVFISPVIFFLSSSGYKQHLVTVRGSSVKFGSDKDDELIKPTIKIPLSVQANLDMQKIGGSVNIDEELTEEETAKLNILDQKKSEADSNNDTVRSYKASKEANGIKQEASDRITPDTQKMKEAADRGETVEEMTEKIKKAVFQNMDDRGKPPLNNIDKLKERSFKRRDKLKKEKVKALEEGNLDKVKEINEDLKSDGINLTEKQDAYKKDLLNYFDSITFPIEIVPKQKDKIDPKEDGTDSSNDSRDEMASSLKKEYASDKSVKVKNILGLNIAKHKEEIEKVGPGESLNIDENPEKIKQHMKDMLDVTVSKSTGEGSTILDPNSAFKQLRSAKENVESKNTEEEKARAKEELDKTQLALSKKMDASRTRQTLSMTSSVVSNFANADVSMDPFAPCCVKDEFDIGFPFPSGVQIPLNQGSSIIKSAIDKLSNAELKSLFGGKNNVGSKDMRLGLLNISKFSVDDSVSVEKPELNLDSATSMFSGILKGLSMPQASLPEELSKQQLDKKTTINTSIVKPIIKDALSKYLDTNLLTANSQNLESDFIYTNSNDIKSFMKNLIDSMTDDINNKLKSFYDIINSAKHGNGIELNVLEKGVFKVPPFGPTAKNIFIAKGSSKLNMSKSDSQFIISEDALKASSSILKTSLDPIVSNPTAYVLAAGAGVTNNTDSLRNIHPILSADDIPPWERLSMKNILFLVFLDEFISTAANQVGFFRSYL